MNMLEADILYIKETLKNLGLQKENEGNAGEANSFLKDVLSSNFPLDSVEKVEEMNQKLKEDLTFSKEIVSIAYCLDHFFFLEKLFTRSNQFFA